MKEGRRLDVFASVKMPASVAIFAKAPIPGYAKTRLIPRLGEAGAAALQRQLTEYAVRVAIEADVGPVALWCMPDCAHPFFAELQRRYGVALHAQAGADLGERMHHAVEAMATAGSVVLMGTDCAVITAAHVRRCVDALAVSDAAAIPVEDGGYFLLALRRPAPTLFDGIAWSTSSVFAGTRAKAAAAGLSLQVFEPLWDIDRSEDYERAVTEGVLPAAGNEIDLSIVIPTLNAAANIGEAIGALAEARQTMQVEIIVVDGGSDDDTCARAAAAGATVVTAPRGRGVQLATGAKRASGPWLLFLHADTTLAPSWSSAGRSFMRAEGARKAAYFSFALDDAVSMARRIEALANWRARTFGLPYGDQGLLISREMYHALGGYRELPLMEDVDIVRRIGKKRLVELPVVAKTSAARYRRDGYIRRPLRNLSLLTLYFLGVSPRRLARLYA
jgi:rSAM/selenodomain-associated transferase 2/rSAM/selenodomain-associated transferase 1